MESTNVQKFTETLGDAVKLAANLSEVTKKENKMQHISDDSNNNQSNPNQTVQIQIADQNTKDIPPKIIHHKPETHVHKEFPDNRALTDKECELSLEKAKMENTLKMKEMEFNSYRADQDRRDRLAREELDRKEKEARRLKEERKWKIKAIVGGIFGVVSAALVGYGIFTDYNSKRNLVQNTQVFEKTTAAPVNPVIPGEGKVD